MYCYQMNAKGDSINVFSNIFLNSQTVNWYFDFDLSLEKNPTHVTYGFSNFRLTLFKIFIPCVQARNIQNTLKNLIVLAVNNFPSTLKL